MPDARELDRAVADRIAAYRPEHVPPFGRVRDAHRRRRVRTGVAAGAAALAVAGAVAVPVALRDPAPAVPTAAAAESAAADAARDTTATPPPSVPVATAETARRLWRATRPPSYTMRVTLLCFCSPTPPRTVVVRSGGTLGAGPSVDDLFATIFSGAFDRVTATYDERWGFPTRVTVDPNLDTIDEERTWVVTDFRPGG